LPRISASISQTDGYAAYRSLADPKRGGGRVTLAFCWAHWRRQFFDIAKSLPAPIATEALKRIAELYAGDDRLPGLDLREPAKTPHQNPGSLEGSRKCQIKK
jgi:hypothetical protein